MKTSDLRNPSSVKKKAIGPYLVPYRNGTGYIHPSVSGRTESQIEHMYWNYRRKS